MSSHVHKQKASRRLKACGRPGGPGERAQRSAPTLCWRQAHAARLAELTLGETLDDALKEAVEAIECHLEGLLMDGEPIPPPQEIEIHQNNPDFAQGIWAFVTVDSTARRGRA